MEVTVRGAANFLPFQGGAQRLLREDGRDRWVALIHPLSVSVGPVSSGTGPLRFDDSLVAGIPIAVESRDRLRYYPTHFGHRIRGIRQVFSRFYADNPKIGLRHLSETRMHTEEV